MLRNCYIPSFVTNPTMHGSNVGTAYLCLGAHQKLIYCNCPGLGVMKEVFQVTEELLSGDNLGNISQLQFRNWSFQLSFESEYFFVAGSSDPVRVLFLPTCIAILKHVVELFLGPNPDYTK